MFAEAKRHTMDRIRAAEVQADPFPHVYIDNVFPVDFYAEMQARLLGDSNYKRLVETGRVSKGYSPERYCLMPDQVEAASGAVADNARFWDTLFRTYCDDAFTQVWIDTFKDAIGDRFARREVPDDLGETPHVAPEIFLMRDRQQYSLSPHTDSPRKVVAALFYLPPDNSLSHLGTTLYAPKDKARRHDGRSHLSRAEFDIVRSMPYRANTLFAFPKTAVSFHGVEPIEMPAQRDIMLFDIKFQSKK
jgi:hypothetical protein